MAFAIKCKKEIALTGHRVQFVDPREQMPLSTTTGNEEDTAE